MSRTAALWAGWDLRAPRGLAGPLAPARGASRPGVPFLDATLGPDARIIVEVAWGADLTASAASWPWTDVSGEVFYADNVGLSVAIGAADEASDTQPATCAAAVDNEDGSYSLGLQSPNWPNVRRNTPLRVRVDLGTGPEVLFEGYLDSTTPTWGAGGRDARVALKASGVLRRIGRRKTPVLSSFRRNTLAQVGLVAYWPCEDLANSTAIASGLTGGPFLGFYLGGPEFATNTTFPCSLPLPKLNGSAWYGPVLPYPVTGNTQIRTLLDFPATSPDASVLFRVKTTGTSDLWELRYKAGFGGILSIRAWGAGVVLFEQDVAFGIDHVHAQIGIQLFQIGANVLWNIDALYLGETISRGFNGTLNARTVGMVYLLETNTDNAHIDLGMGHITVQNTITDEFVQINALNAYILETATDRIRRLCAENDINLEVLSGAQASDATTMTCGYQSVEAILPLLREAELAGQGILYDGLGDGFIFADRYSRENNDPFLTVDVAAGDLSGDWVPVDDDQRNVNLAKVDRKGGSSYTFEDRTGPLGTAAIGVYDTGTTVNTAVDSDLPNYASWFVHKGTVPGYRYPRLNLDLTHSVELIRRWLVARLGDRINVVGIETVLAQHPAGVVSLALEGYAHQISQDRWMVTANCAPYGPWEIGVWAADVGDTSPRVLRFDTDGSSLSAPAAAGDTSLVVVTPSGPPWTTAADDFPLQIDLAGLMVTVTTISGVASPQTFTVDPTTVTAPRAAGSAVFVMTSPLGL